jgi:thioredoxin-dependent peroxiredoxin
MQTTSRPEVGQQAPDFTAANTEGRKIRLSDYRGKKVVLYFYPKDDTPGCTVESCGFRDSYQVIQDTGAEILGVSVDDVGSHGRFTEKYRLPFTLVADVDKKITQSYGVVNEKSGNARRVTFLIDARGNIFKIFDPVKPDIHAKEVLDALRA